MEAPAVAYAEASTRLLARMARVELDDRTAPMAGLVATFVFATQMVNFPVGAGTSGHLLGGALAAILVGPWTAVLCLSVVLLVQGLLFADGGVTALGTNITLLGIVGVVVGWLVFRGLQAVLPKRLGLVPGLAAVAAYVTVPVTALAFVGLYAMGGQAPLPLDTLTGAMVGCCGGGHRWQPRGCVPPRFERHHVHERIDASLLDPGTFDDDARPAAD